MRILIVDDSKTVATVIDTMLKEEQYTCVWVGDGQEAIDLLRTDKHFDLILLDWTMPIIDGPTFLKQVKSEKITTAPIVMLTAENKMQKIVSILEQGICEYITKPFTKDILLSKINLALRFNQMNQRK
ncbi:MAG: response regulator transcription factor [Oligoflexia bacterium]|nr:response regulator transcription factor [Oligoflexia bacterium]